MLKRIIKRIFNIPFQFANQELPAFLLHKVYHSGMYLPYTISSLKLRSLACILNDIVINSRSKVLELGAGISTILIARMAKLNGIPLIIYSIDQNADWIQYLSNIAQKEDLTQYIHFVYAPLSKSSEFDLAYEFDKKVVSNQIDQIKFDVFLIDGPTASKRENKFSRATNYHFLESHLAERASIFVDNTNREGERMLVEKIKNGLNLKEVLIDNDFSIFVRGTHFNFRL